jgi:tetraacyldisaccharide 4'-kinase
MNEVNFIKSAMYKSETKRKRMFSPLFLLSKVYGFIIDLRRAFYKIGLLRKRKIDAYVISVGNIVVGGTGKTPTVIYLSKLLQKNGFKVCVLSRGYKGKNTAKYHVVSDGEQVLSNPQTAGDEPYLMAKKLSGIPVVIGKNRCIAGKYAVQRFKPDVCILDDGFQHFKLKRDLDIVTFDGNIGFGNGNLLPNGILREHVSALERADIVLINKGTKKSSDIISAMTKYKKYNSRYHVFFCRYDADGLSGWIGGKEEISFISGKKVFAFSALANADYFYETITRFGGDICGRLEYKDHHYYNIDDYFKIVKSAYDSNADFVLTTQKDIVKFNKEWSNTSSIKIFSLDVSLKPLGPEDTIEC